MSRFEDHLWREFVRERGNSLAQMSTPTVKRTWRGPRLIAGTSIGLAGLGAAVALALGGTTTSPAFAVTRNHDGTVTVSIERASGIPGANAKLHQLGVRAKLMRHVPTGYSCTSTVARQGQGASVSATETASASRSAGAEPTASIANAHWTIDPRKIPAGRTLALTPPPAPPAPLRAKSGNSTNGGQVWWSCGTEGTGAGGPPPAPPGSKSASSSTS